MLTSTPDPTDTFSYPDDVPKPTLGKKSRTDTPDSDSESESEESEQHSLRAKRRKLSPSSTVASTVVSDVCPTDVPRVDSVLPGTHVMQLSHDSKPDTHMTDAAAHMWSQQASKDMQNSHTNCHDSKQVLPIQQQWQPFDMTYGGGAVPWTAQGFPSTQGWPEGVSAPFEFDGQEAFSQNITFPGKQDYYFPQASSALQQPVVQHVYPAHMVTSVSQPHFHALPNTPLMPPSNLFTSNSDQAQATANAFRPNGHGWHGLPTYDSHPPQSSSAPGSGYAHTAQQNMRFDQQPSLPPRSGAAGDNRLDFSPYPQRHVHAGHQHSHPSTNTLMHLP